MQISCEKIMKNKHNRYFFIASQQAQKSNMHKNFGAVLVCNNKIIGIGHNHSIDYCSRKYNYVSKERKLLQNIHAENDAIIDAIKKGNGNLISKSDIYISRILNDYDSFDEYNFQTSHPCENCRNLIDKYKIKKAYYIN
jgi:deoxycytidylate deaminase